MQPVRTAAGRDCKCTNTEVSSNPRKAPMHLEALAMHDGRPRLVVLLLRDPHLLEGRQGGQDGAANPDLRRSPTASGGER